MKLTSTYRAKHEPLTEEQEREIAEAKTAAETKRRLDIEAQEAATARADGATVSLSEKSLHALTTDDQRLRRNIQWGIVRGLFLYSLFMIPVAIVAALIIAGSR